MGRPEASDRRYTLSEARRELRRQECAQWGHDWDVVTTGDGKPRVLMCGRCQRSWAVGDEAAGPVDDHLVDLPLGEQARR